MSEALGSLYGTIDSYKRRLADALRNPRLALEQAVGNANDRARSLNEMTAAAADEGVNFGPATQRLGAAMADAYNPAGIFIGGSSPLFNKSDALRAAQLQKKGVSPREIWKETGTFKAPDGFWRQEIDDSQAVFRDRADIALDRQALEEKIAALKDRVRPNRSGQKDLFPKQLTEARKGIKSEIEAKDKTLGEYYGYQSHPEYTGNFAPIAYQHPELYKAYPELERYVVQQGHYGGEGLHGSFDRQRVEVNSPAFRTPDGPRSTATHELQHAVQDIEGFAPGGNADYAYRLGNQAMSRVREINDEMTGLATVMGNKLLPVERQAEARARYQDLMAEREQIRPFTKGVMDPYGAYRALHGEAEARAAQKRIDYSPAKRREVFPLDDYDLPVDELIIQKNDIIDALRKRK